MPSPLRLSAPLLALVALALAASGPARAQSGSSDASCRVCHSDEWVAYQESAHAKTGLLCVDCHGGDGGDMHETAMSKQDCFRPAPKREDVPASCAACHADRDRMRPFGIATTQFEDYQTSQHGKLLAGGDTKVAVCTDCHSSGKDKGRHDILAIEDSRASVYPSNLPVTCGRCHSDAALMKPYGIPTDQVSLYRESVHGKAMLEGGNMAAATCVVCHGSHSAGPPDAATIDDVCGRCHRREHELVSSSPHGPLESRPEAGFRWCVSCHGEPDGGGHGIVAPTADSFGSMCTRCHPSDSAAAVSEALRGLLTGGDACLAEARKLVASATEEGFHARNWDDILKDAQSQSVQARIAQHSLVPGDTERYTQAIESARDDLRGEIGKRAGSLVVRKVALLPVWGLVFWSCGLLLLKRRRAMAALHEPLDGGAAE